MLKKQCFQFIVIGVLFIFLSACSPVVIETDMENQVPVPENSRLFIVKGYNEERKTLIVDAAEWVNETDTERINELENEGRHLDFPNSYTIIRYEGTYEFAFCENPKIALLNVVQPEKSTLEELIEKVKMYDTLFCFIVIEDNVIVELVEPYTV